MTHMLDRQFSSAGNEKNKYETRGTNKSRHLQQKSVLK